MCRVQGRRLSRWSSRITISTVLSWSPWLNLKRIETETHCLEITRDSDITPRGSCYFVVAASSRQTGIWRPSQAERANCTCPENFAIKYRLILRSYGREYYDYLLREYGAPLCWSNLSLHCHLYRLNDLWTCLPDNLFLHACVTCPSRICLQ